MKKNLLKAILFPVIGIVLFFAVQSVLGVSNHFSEHTEMMFKGYYEEPEDTLDAVLIGNSHIYKFWQGAFGWQEYGVAAMALSTSDMPASVMKNIAVEACRTQSPKLLVFDSTAFALASAEENNKIYLIQKNMKFSRNYIDMMENYFDYAGITGFDKLRYYFPILQFHSRWKEVSSRDFVQMYPSYLNSCYLSDFLKDTIEYKEHISTDERIPIGEKNEEVLRDLLEWCTQQDMEVLFIASPTLLEQERLGMVNYVGDIIQEYGIHFINYNEQELFDTFDFDVTVDFQDPSHTNINGSWKFTKVFGQYLIDQYGLEDHRGESTYSSWDTKAKEYMKVIQEYFIY